MNKLSTILVTSLLLSCGKDKPEQNPSVIKNYKALDGTRSQATIEHPNESNEVFQLESANGQKIQLDLKSSQGGVKIYERSGVSAEIKGDSLIIKQDEKIIPLVEIK